MTLESYLLFLGASIVLCIVPGPDMLYLLGRCIAQGRKAGMMAALGINLGSYVHLAAAVLGLSAVLAASSFAFTLIKWAGAIYLIYLGVQALRSKRNPLTIDADSLSRESARTIFWQGFVSDVLNPKVAMFYLALLPQFVHADGANVTQQLLLLGVTANVVGILISTVLVYLSAAVTARLRGNSVVAAYLHKTMGALFIALGLRLASQKM